MLVPLEISERNKYAKIWKEKNYSSGNSEAFSKIILNQFEADSLKNRYVLELGCGNCELMKILEDYCFVLGVDITTKQVPEEFSGRVYKSPIWDISFLQPKKITCSLDVLEHIPPQKIDDTIKEILRLTENVTIHAICTRPALTLLNGENAHLTVKPLSWWQQKFDQHNTNNIKIILLDSDTL